jgi:hypothetical protein
MKAQVNLGLSKLSIPEKIEKAKHFITKMTGNINFPIPLPTLPDVAAAIVALEVACDAAQGGGPLQTTVMRDKEKILDKLLTKLGNYVANTADESVAVILSAGMEVRTKGGKTLIIFSAKESTLPNELILQAPAVKRHAYVWQMAIDSLPGNVDGSTTTGNWQQVGVSIKAKFIIKNLNSGIKYWFRVATVGREGQNVWSDPISKMIGI